VVEQIGLEDKVIMEEKQLIPRPRPGVIDWHRPGTDRAPECASTSVNLTENLVYLGAPYLPDQDIKITARCVPQNPLGLEEGSGQIPMSTTRIRVFNHVFTVVPRTLSLSDSVSRFIILKSFK